MSFLPTKIESLALIVLVALTPLAAVAQGPSPSDPAVPRGEPRFLVQPDKADAELKALKAGNENSPSVCNAVLQHAANVYASEFSIDDKKSWVYQKKCGSSSRSSNTGIDLIVDALSLGFSDNQAEQAKWCNEHESYSSRVQGYQRLENRVMATAIQNWSQCIDAYSQNLFVHVTPSLDDNVFQFRVKNGTDVPRVLTGLGVISNEGTGLTCDSKIPPNVTIKPSQWHSFVCQRNYVTVQRDGKPYEVLPGGSISVANNLSPYLYSFRERFRNDDVPTEKIVKRVFVLDGQHIATKGYWSEGRRSAILYCSGAVPNDQPRVGFDLIDMGKREVRSQGRGACPRAGFCDSHGEFCNELFWVKGCYINKEWHEWYKGEIARVGIAYSGEAVCAPSRE